MRRGEAFLNAGADILFFEAPQSLEELRRVGETFKGARLVANMVEDGKTPYLSVSELKDLGFNLVIYPVSSLLVVSKTLQNTYRDILRYGKLPNSAERLRFAEYNSLVGLDKLVPSAAE
jgi:2,3-dimethylmalate lyase